MRFSYCTLRVFGVLTAFILAGCGANSGTTLPANGGPSHDAPSKSAHFRDLHFFCNQYPSCTDGGDPSGSLIFDAAGAIYGPLGIGGGGAHCGQKYGCGAVFKLAPSGSGYTYGPQYSFCAVAACHDGSAPSGNLVFDARGSLYGTTTAGGANNEGVVFKLTPAGSSYRERVLYHFCQASNCTDGGAPQAGVIFDAGGDLYGTTPRGGANGSGTVFKLTPSGSGYTERVLYSFCRRAGCEDGAAPAAGLVMDKSGVLYGTTPSGGNGNHGVVFNLTPSGPRYTQHVLYRFCKSSGGCADGAFPQAALILDQQGALYGTTYGGGTNCYSFGDRRDTGRGGCGVVFRLTLSGTRYTERVLHRFCHELIACTDGAFPAGGVVLGAGGALYGATISGGRGPGDEGRSGGIIFELTPSGSRYAFKILHNFRTFDDLFPSTTPVLGSNGALYGTSTGGINIRGPATGAVWEKPL
ncbi:MAG TPA: choice-of-anchor tandem repeat GloVer-containing protein [Candidatus Cybelea sp.]|nr:choice-of-anchor tandem repeat GloVer-containing protein [Candidatus Cybelea sp.]